MGNYTRQHYHAHRRGVPSTSWRLESHSPNGKRVGIELELEHSKGYARLLELLPDTNGVRPHTERDGSLNERNGLEIIFPPYSYAGIRRKDSYFQKALAEINKDPPITRFNTGMHMNVNTHGWPLNKKKLFASFIHSIPNSVVLKLGGRSPNQWCKRGYRPWMDAMSYRKGEMAWIRANRIEVRFPKATTNIQSILNLVTLFELVEEFVGKRGSMKHFSLSERGIRFDDVGLYFRDEPEPIGFSEMCKSRWKSFKEFVNAKPKTKNVKAFLEAIG
jgi:hypothetical protein